MKSIVAERGQVTIPKALRDKLGIRSGTALEFSARNGTLIAHKALGMVTWPRSATMDFMRTPWCK